jgi:hypothetical protein
MAGFKLMTDRSQQNETSNIIEQFLKKIVADRNRAPTVTTDDQHRLGDLDYRVELDPELAPTPLGQLAYWDIREKSGGDVSQYIKNVMGNPEKDYIMGDDPEDPIYGTRTRGIHDPSTGIVRANVTDLVDLFGPEHAELQQQRGGDVVMAHELGHAGIQLLTEAKKLPEGSNRFYEEDILQILDAIGYGTRGGKVSPPWKSEGIFSGEGPVGKSDRSSEEKNVDYARTATGVMTGELGDLTPYERELAAYVTELNKVATEELASRKKSYKPPVKKAEGGLLSMALSTESQTSPMISKYILDSTLVQNLNQGLGVPSYLEGTTIQKLLQPSVDLNNPAYANQNTLVADNTLAQSNYMNTRRMA